MEGALAWIGKIADWIGQWIPRWVVLDPTEGAIKYVGGKRIVPCGAGVHFYWPARTIWQAYPVARQTDRLESQTMESKDGKTFIVAGTLTYKVLDIEKLLPVTHSPSTAVIDIAMTAVHDVCCQFDWEALQEEQRRGTLKTKLRNAAQRDLTELGIEVMVLKLNTLARCRVLKISQSTSTEEN
jgi:regulator of protease activity HflC (stomatin/prohibitin superfamily)